MARDSRGRFIKGSSRAGATTRRSSGGGGTLVIRQTTAPASKKRKGGGRRSIVAGAHSGERVRKGAAIGGFLLGYVKKNHASTLEKVPAIKGSHIAGLAIGLHFLAKPKPGSVIDHVATAATAVAAYELGQSGLAGDDAEW